MKKESAGELGDPDYGWWGFSRKPMEFSEQTCFRALREKDLGWETFHEKEEVRGHRGQKTQGRVVTGKRQSGWELGPSYPYPACSCGEQCWALEDPSLGLSTGLGVRKVGNLR